MPKSHIAAKIICYIRGVEIVETPEEKVRQEYARRLVEEFGYPKELIDVEVPIQLGRDESKRADIVVYRSKQDREKRENHCIIVECKELDIKFPDGEKQLKAYVNATTTQIGVWTNGIEFKYWKRLKEPDRYEEKGYLPKYGQEYGDKKILKKDLRPSSNLQATFKRIHDNIYANYKSGRKEKVFYQVIYLLFAKIQDEKSRNAECEFVIYDREWDEIRDKDTSKTFQKRIFDLFEQAKSREEFKSIFDGSEKIEIPIRQIANVVSEFENITVLDTDVKGEAFQAFLSGYFRGDAGQFFTPDPIKKLVVEMLEPEPDEVVLDPACGSSGFLVFAINHFRNLIKKQRGWVDTKGTPLNDVDLTPDQREILRGQTKEYASTHIKGVDFDNDLTKVAKMYMVMTDDGHTGIWTSNALIPFDEFTKNTKGTITPESADIITTNPPFGSKGKVEDPNILSGYDFGFAWKKDKETGEFQKGKLLAGKRGGGQVPDILFIERCLALLKKGGRMGMVLPDGDLTNKNTEFVRAWLKNKAQITAVISLPQETFVPFGAGVKSSVLFLKKPKDKLPERYPILFASLEKIGYDIRGRKTYKRNENGEIVDGDGRPIEYLTDRKGNKTKQDPALIEMRGDLDTDIPNVLTEWKKLQKGMVKEIGKGLEDKIFVRWSNEIDFVTRLDVNFWLFAASKIKGTKLSEVATIQTGKQYEFYENVNDAVPFISIKDFEGLFVEDTDRFVLRNAIVEKTRIGKGDILLAVTGATIGKVGVFMGKEGVVSADVAIIRPKKMSPFFLATLLQSKYGKRIVDRYTYGATNKHLNIKGFVENFVVPELNQNEINRVSKLTEEAIKQRIESKRKLQEAKDFVENLIYPS